MCKRHRSEPAGKFAIHHKALTMHEFSPKLGDQSLASVTRRGAKILAGSLPESLAVRH
jgi:hypothetical protein